MEEDILVNKIEFCFGCLSKSDEHPLLAYRFQTTAFNFIQNDFLPLCYVCKKRAENTETFILRVQTNQLLLHSADSYLDCITAIHSNQNLSYNRLTMINLNGKNNLKDYDEVWMVVPNSWDTGNIPEELEIEETPIEQPTAEESTIEETIHSNQNLSYNRLTMINLNGKNNLKDYDEVWMVVPNSWDTGNIPEELEIEETAIEQPTAEESTIEATMLDDPVNSKASVDEPKVKMELKIENHNNGDVADFFISFADDNDILEANIKEELDEDDFPLKVFKMENLGVACPSKVKKKGKVKNKKKDVALKCKEEKIKKERKSQNKVEIAKVLENGEYADDYVETIRISKEECIKEREEMAASEKYLNCALKCEYCIKGFNYNASYDRHMVRHSEMCGEFACDICNQRYMTEERVRDHKKYHFIRFRCKICNLVRVNRSTMQDHYTSVHCNNVNFTCPYCAKAFKRHASVRKHIWNMHNSKEKPGGGKVECAYCNKIYSNKTSLKAHLINKHPTQVSAALIAKRHKCEECGAAFSAPSLLHKHMVKHDTWRRFYCVECDKSFKSHEILKHHLKTAMPHTKDVVLPLSCNYCDKRFAVKRDLNRHMNRVHLNVRPFKCDSCEKAYVNNWSLNEHKKLHHEGFKRPLRFPCPLCDKVFDRNQILKGHMRTHTGERPYVCKRCGATFGQAGSLGTHVKLVHLRLTRDGRPRSGYHNKSKKGTITKRPVTGGIVNVSADQILTNTNPC